MSEWPAPLDLYTTISGDLDRWAEKNALEWQRIWRDSSVRSISFPLPASESIQIWLDPPSAGSTTIRVALNSALESRRKASTETRPQDELEKGLDEALRRARAWLATEGGAAL